MFFWWETFLAETNVHDVPVIVVGNKLDTADKKREVTRERAEKWCRDNGGFQYIEVFVALIIFLLLCNDFTDLCKGWNECENRFICMFHLLLTSFHYTLR
jgi:hypothetical protein